MSRHRRRWNDRQRIEEDVIALHGSTVSRDVHALVERSLLVHFALFDAYAKTSQRRPGIIEDDLVQQCRDGRPIERYYTARRTDAERGRVVELCDAPTSVGDHLAAKRAHAHHGL